MRRKRIGKYFRDGFKDVTKAIESARTTLIFGNDLKAEFKAREVSKSINSYYYEVFSMKDGRKVQIGYAIPK